jgi:serine/threonine protein kinase
MNRPPAHRRNEPLRELLAAYDEALASETNPDPSLAVPPLGQEALFSRLQGLLHRLDRLRPRSLGNSPTLFSLPADLTRLGRFELRRCLGQGGFGIVYLAFDTRLHRTVALKVPRLEAAHDRDARARFLREGRAAAGLSHPNIVTVYEAGEDAGICYIASAFCPGLTLAAWLRTQATPIPFAAAGQLIGTLAKAAQHAHSRGVLHRDLKPGNILLMSTGLARGECSDERPAIPPPTAHHWPLTPVIVDFGLAKLTENNDASTRQTDPATRTGVVLGTLAYMAPEQVRGQTATIGPAVDVYALGAILYELVVGHAPFPGQEGIDTVRRVIEEEPAPLRRLRPEVPRDLETICLKCLRKAPGKRYSSALALAEDLERWLAGKQVQARPVRAWEKALQSARRHPTTVTLLACACVAAFALVAGLIRHQQTSEREELNQRRATYVQRMAAAQPAWEKRDWRTLASLLEGLRPPAGKPDVRGFEWH